MEYTHIASHNCFKFQVIIVMQYNIQDFMVDSETYFKGKPNQTILRLLLSKKN